MSHLDAQPGLRAIALAWAALVGASAGSFLNVVIARVPHGRSVVRPRSACPRCGAPIAWYDNVPVLSWILLRARCRSCGGRISFRYPLVEVLCAVAGTFAVWRHGLGPAALAELVFVAMLLALALVDLDTWLLPHALTWPLITLGLLANAARIGPAPGLGSALAGSAVGFAAFATVSVVGARLFRREALGWGDVWLLSGIGAWLGLRALLPVVLLASLQGSVVGIALVLLGRGQPGPAPRPEAPASPEGGGDVSGAPESPAPPEPDGEAAWVPPRNAVPFGPFLALAALEWLYLGPALPVLDLFR